MNRLKNALTRKIGPFSAWVWFGIAAGALYFYRRHTAGSGDQQQGALTYYGPYGQDAYPIQGGLGTGPGPDTGAGTNNDGGNTNGGPPNITVNAPPSAPNDAGGKPRTQKPQPKHKIKNKPKKHSLFNKGKKSAKRSDTTTHTNQARTKTVSRGGTKRTQSRPRTPTGTHEAGGQTVTPGHGKQTSAPAAPPARHHGSPGRQTPHPAPGTKHPQQPAHKEAPKSGPKPPPHTPPHASTKPARRKVTRR